MPFRRRRSDRQGAGRVVGAHLTILFYFTFFFIRASRFGGNLKFPFTNGFLKVPSDVSIVVTVIETDIRILCL